LMIPAQLCRAASRPNQTRERREGSCGWFRTKGALLLVPSGEGGSQGRALSPTEANWSSFIGIQGISKGTNGLQRVWDRPMGYRMICIGPPKGLWDKNDRNRFQVQIAPTQLVYGLTINFLTPRDSGIYYCAYCVGGYLVFGSGAKLIISRSSPPANSEILQKKHENQIIYVCLIEKFYPEVIRVTWTDDEKEVTDNVVKGDTWQSTKEDEYSIASWLTVPAENKDKKYYCKYEHEEEKASLPTQETTKSFPRKSNLACVMVLK
uniref:Uncharacterized protein n=1 Tax=Corvus moneduloides TaxID=1196302 RepID=A0A8C3ENY1_CORMO